MQAAYDADANGSDTRIDLTANDDSLIFSNPSSSGTDSTYVLKVEQLNTGALDALQVTNSGTGNILTLQDTGTTVLGVTDGGNLVANNSATGTTGTTTGTGTTTTTLTLTTDPFSVNDVIYIDNVGQDYVTRITVDPGTNSYTVSPAVTFETGRTVTRYVRVQNIGATSTDYSSLSNRFFQGYFLGGIVTGTGSTTYADALISSTPGLTVNTSSATAAALTVNNVTSTGNIATFQDNGASVFSIADGGNVTGVAGATTGTAYSLSANSLTTGSGLSLSSTSTSLTSGNILGISHTATYTSSSLISGNVLSLSRAITANDSSTPTVVRDSTTETTAGTYSHTVANQPNRILIVSVSEGTTTGGPTAGVPTSVTYGGVALTMYTSLVNSATSTSIWYLINPTAQTANVVISPAVGDTFVSSQASTLYNVNQTTPLTGAQTSTSGTPSVTVSSGSGDLVFDHFTHRTNAAITTGAGQTQIMYQLNGSTMRAKASTEAGAASVTMSATGSATSATYIAYNVEAVANSGPSLSGAVASISSVCSITTGTCYDSANVLNVTQNNTGSTGSTLKVASAGTGNSLEVSTTNTSGTQTAGVSIDRNGAGGTTTSLLSLSNTAGTATNGILFTGTIGTDITTATNRALTIDSNGTGSITLGGGTGIKTIDIATGGTGAKTVTLGSTASTGATTIQSGSGNIILQSAGSGTIGRIQIGAGSAGSTTPDFLALDVKSTTGDPAGGAEGYIYYNTFDNKFRCYENTGWSDCITSPGGLFTDAGTYAYLTATTDNMTLGSSTAGGKLFVDGDTDEVQLQVQANATQTTDIFSVESNGGATVYLAVSSNGVTAPGGSQSERFGAGASASGSNGTALGYTATANSNNSSAFGSGAVASNTYALALGFGSLASGQQSIALNDATASTQDSIAIGFNALANTEAGNIALGSGAISSGAGTFGNASIALGYSTNASGDAAISLGSYAIANGNRSIAVGNNSTNATFDNSIALGAYATNTTANQIVIGGSGHAVYDLYLGQGVTHAGAATSDASINATSGSGSNVSGADLWFNAGQGTGTGIGGSLIFQTSAAGLTGSSLNSLTTRLTIDSTGLATFAGDAVFDGHVKVGPDAGTYARFHVNGDANETQLLVTSNSTQTNPTLVVEDSAGTDVFTVASTGNTVAYGTLTVSIPATDGNIFRLQDSDGTCDYNPESGSVTVSCSSDERLKSNIVDHSGSLDYLMGFNIKDYTINASGDTTTGVIAQEVLLTNPELVTMGEDGYYKVAQLNTWILADGIQELAVQQATIDTRLDVVEQGNFSGNISVAADAYVGDDLVVADDVTIQSDLTVVGRTSVQTLTVSGKIITAGIAPAAVLGQSAVVGQGSAVSVTGNDTAGSVSYTAGSVNLPSYNLATGAQISVVFNQAFTAAPRIALTPKDAGSAAVRHYVETTATGFTIYFVDTPASANTYSFDYIVIQ